MSKHSPQNDALLEILWRRFDTPVDEEAATLLEPYLHFPVGTPQEDVWHWFDDHHSKGVYWLMFGDEGEVISAGEDELAWEYDDSLPGDFDEPYPTEDSPGYLINLDLTQFDDDPGYDDPRYPY